MTISLLNDCLQLKEQPGEKLQDHLRSAGLQIFDPIFHGSQNSYEGKLKVLYILCAYSEDSPLLILRQDTKEEKEAICQYLQIPDYMRSYLFQLKEREVRTATTQYLTQFSGPLFKSYKFLQIQVEDIELDITNRAFGIKTTKDEVTTEVFDIKEHGKAVTEHSRLSRQLDKLEKEMRQGHLKRLEGLDDLKKFCRDGQDTILKGQRTGNVENKIRNN